MVIGSLQKLRGVAAALVVADHALLYARRISPAFDAYESLAHIFGGIGVGVFFVISGFIMYHTSSNQFGSISRSKSFLFKRIIRVVPLYYLATIALLFINEITGVISRTGYAIDLGEIISSFAFFPHLNSDPDNLGKIYPILAQGWTLNYEMFFYLIFAFCLSFKRYIGLSLLFCAFSLIIGIGFVCNFSNNDIASVVLRFWTNPIIALFVCGIIIGIFVDRGYFPVCRIDPFVPSLAAMTVAIILLSNQGLVGEDHIRSAMNMIFCVLVVGVSVMPFSRNDESKKSLMLTLGDGSYSVYLFHSFVIGVIGRLWLKLIPGQMPWIFILICILASISVGHIIYSLIERPSVGLIRGVAFRRKKEVIYAER